jgi:hypothetical protein
LTIARPPVIFSPMVCINKELQAAAVVVKTYGSCALPSSGHAPGFPGGTQA